MDGPSDFESYVRGALGVAGVSLDEIELAVILAARAAYGPGQDALMAADLSSVAPELDLDPSRAPAETA